MSEGKNRIDHRLLYDCISTNWGYLDNVRSFSFLECLIEEHNKESGDTMTKKTKPEISLEMEPSLGSVKKIVNKNPEKDLKSAPKKNPQTKIGVGQTSLDFFVTKQRWYQ